MSEWNLRQWSLLGFVFCVLMMAVALVLEHGFGLTPCPLCVFQRVAVIIAGLVFLIAMLHAPTSRLGGVLYGLLAALPVIGGIALAGRHLWLQSLPADEVPSCGPGLDYMLDVLPMQQVVSTVLSGSGECAEVGARLLGLSLPGWTMIGFVVLLLIPVAMMCCGRMRGCGYRWNG